MTCLQNFGDFDLFTQMAEKRSYKSHRISTKFQTVPVFSGQFSSVLVCSHLLWSVLHYSVSSGLFGLFWTVLHCSDLFGFVLVCSDLFESTLDCFCLFGIIWHCLGQFYGYTSCISTAPSMWIQGLILMATICALCVLKFQNLCSFPFPLFEKQFWRGGAIGAKIKRRFGKGGVTITFSIFNGSNSVILAEPRSEFICDLGVFWGSFRGVYALTRGR